MLKVFIIPILFVFQAFGGVRENIVKCANGFIGTPYDTNPIGQYVENKDIVYDSEMDCMYFVFRCTEIAKANFNEEESQKIALNLRFKTQGIIGNDGKVQNYDERFDYAEDMVLSTKWGKNVTRKIGKISKIEGSRGIAEFEYVKNSDIKLEKFKNGDIIFWVKPFEKRVVGEIIGHLGFVEDDEGSVYFVHASGIKNKKKHSDGVTKILLKEYLEKTKFIGVAVKRFN